MKKKIAIVGGGIGGVSCGIYAQLNGYESFVFEKNDHAGGCCSSYSVDGFVIDHCIHWLNGTSYGSQLNDLWREVHAIDDSTKMIKVGDICSIEYQGNIYRIQRDYKATIEEWLKQSPEDEKVIRELEIDFKHASEINLRTESFKDFKEDVKTLNKFVSQNIKHINTLIKSSFISRPDVAQKFKNQGLRRLIENCQNGYSNWFGFLFEYSLFMQDNANIPQGGSAKFFENMLKYYEELGGKVFLNDPVSKIIVENKIARGVETEKDGRFLTDYVIIACPFNYARSNLFDVKLKRCIYDKFIKEEKLHYVPSAYQLALTVKADLHCWPIPLGIALDDYIDVGKKRLDTIMCRCYYYDPELYVKDGKTVMTVFIDQNSDDFDYWNSLTREEYIKEKDRVNHQLVEIIEKHKPELKGKIEILDSFTPVTIAKHINSPFGGYMSFSLNKRHPLFIGNPKFRGIKNLYLSGQWLASPGGTPFALSNSPRTIKAINRNEGIWTFKRSL